MTHFQRWRRTGRAASYKAAATLAMAFGLVACIAVKPDAPPAPGRNDGGATGGKAMQGNSAAKIAVAGPRTEKALSSFERDLSCTRVVVPFDLTDNAVELLDLGVQGAANSFSQWLDNLSKGVSADRNSTQLAGAVRHKIPLELRATALRMNWLPMAAEVRYGEFMLDKMNDQLLRRDSKLGKNLYPKADRLLSDALDAVKEPHAYVFKAYISTASGTNAMALPGGFVIVDAALLQDPALESKAYYAVAHEIGHVLQRHETRAAQARIVDTISLGGSASDLVPGIRSMATNPDPLLKLALAGKLQFERHFADQELQADACSIRVMSQGLVGDAQLANVVKNVTAEMLKAVPSENDAAKPMAVKAVRQNNSAAAVQQASKELENLMEVVSRPIDRHPTSKERADHLGKMLRLMRPNAVVPAAPVPKSKSITPPKASRERDAAVAPSVTGVSPR